MIVGLVRDRDTRDPRPTTPAWARTIEIEVDG
jgi:hypothetical protein